MIFSGMRFGLILVAGLLGTQATAQVPDAWQPKGPVTLVLHSEPGGASDVLARTLTRSLQPIIGRPLLMQHAYRGVGSVQMAQVARSQPDGRTPGADTMCRFTAMPANLSSAFSPQDSTWITVFQFDPHIVMTSPERGLMTLDEMVAKAEVAPGGQLTISDYGSAGSIQHFTMSMLAEQEGFAISWGGFDSTPEALMGGLFGLAGMDPALAPQIVDASRKAQQNKEFEAFDSQSGAVRSAMGPADMRATSSRSPRSPRLLCAMPA